MRRREPKPKTRKPTPLPADLQAFLAEVHGRIEAGDETTLVESDDLLQCANAYGGRCVGGNGEFGFTYFPESSARPGWEFVLTAAEIGHIARRAVTQLELWCCEAPGCTFRSSLQDDTCRVHDWVDE